VQSLVNLSAIHVPAVKFESDQLWVRDAACNGSQLRVDVRLFFFALSGEEVMDPKTEEFLTTSFTNQKVKYASPFKPELVKEIDSSQGMSHSKLSRSYNIFFGRPPICQIKEVKAVRTRKLVHLTFKCT